jgi:hypothetical protein
MGYTGSAILNLACKSEFWPILLALDLSIQSFGLDLSIQSEQIENWLFRLARVDKSFALRYSVPANSSFPFVNS